MAIQDEIPEAIEYELTAHASAHPATPAHVILGASAIQQTAASTGPTSVKNSTWKPHSQFSCWDGDSSTARVAATSQIGSPRRRSV